MGMHGPQGEIDMPRYRVRVERTEVRFTHEVVDADTEAEAREMARTIANDNVCSWTLLDVEDDWCMNVEVIGEVDA